jgi:hypothetical protein
MFLHVPCQPTQALTAVDSGAVKQQVSSAEELKQTKYAQQVCSYHTDAA